LVKVPKLKSFGCGGSVQTRKSSVKWGKSLGWVTTTYGCRRLRKPISQRWTFAAMNIAFRLMLNLRGNHSGGGLR